MFNFLTITGPLMSAWADAAISMPRQVKTVMASATRLKQIPPLQFVGTAI